MHYKIWNRHDGATRTVECETPQEAEKIAAKKKGDEVVGVVPAAEEPVQTDKTGRRVRAR